MDLPALNDIRIFVAVGREGTLTAAARELKMPASTVSRAITRLERHLNILLVQRSSRGLVITDFGREYLQSCRRALHTLREGGEALEGRRARPSGLIRVACPITMARSIFAPLLKEFLDRYPDLRIALEPYSSGWNQEPQEDIDVYFKVRAPKDSIRRVRLYPGTRRALFASSKYLEAAGMPTTPEGLAEHVCVGSGAWKLTRGTKTAAPDIAFKVTVSDPVMHLELAQRGLGIAILPLYMGRRPGLSPALVPVLPQWAAEPITLCALFSGAARLTPKVKVLLDFLDEYIGTEKDPRLHRLHAKGLFTDAGRPRNG